MKIASAEQMRQIDMDSITRYGIPEIVLMENAGNEIAKEAILKFGDRKKFCIVAGYGNNGGDAFVAARHLLNSGAQCKIFLLGSERRDSFSPSARINYNILETMGVEIYHMVSERDWNRFQIALTFSDAVIDGLLGTGINGELSELALKCIKQINNGKCPVISIDIPSGLNADSGLPSPEAVKAKYTITFGVPKIGMYMLKARDYIGEVVTKNIGIPTDLLCSPNLKNNAVDKEFVIRNIEKRDIDCYKGSCGKVLVIAGSTYYTGAAKIASEAVLRIGAGISTLAVPSSIYQIIASSCFETIVKPLKENMPGVLGADALNNIIELANEADVILIGPGLGRAPDTLNVICDIVKNIDKPMVIDADGIFALKEHKDIIKARRAITVLTPHLGELAHFTDIEVEKLKNNLIDFCTTTAKELNCHIVAKSEQTITFYPTGEIYINTTGNPGMATAGMGDILAGIIAGLIAEGKCGLHYASIGVYLHGLAGDIASKAGMAGILARDVLNNLQSARGTIEIV